MTAYEGAIEEARQIVESVNAPEDVQAAAKAITGLRHALTSEKEAKAMLKSRLSDLNIVWDKTAKAYRYAE